MTVPAQGEGRDPRWIGDALIADCAKCANLPPGAIYQDGSGVCQACKGARYIVLATHSAAGQETGK